MTISIEERARALAYTSVDDLNGSLHHYRKGDSETDLPALIRALELCRESRAKTKCALLARKIKALGGVVPDGRKTPAQTGATDGSDQSDSNTTQCVVFGEPGQPVPLQAIEEQLKHEFKALEQQSAWRALRIGLLLLHGKERVGHGRFLTWMKKIVPEYGHRQAQRFINVARHFIDHAKVAAEETLLLCAPERAPGEQLPAGEGSDQLPPAVTATPPPELVQKAVEFIGPRSLRGLFDKYGVMPKGGFHPPEGTIAEYAEANNLEPDYDEWPVETQRAFRAWLKDKLATARAEAEKADPQLVEKRLREGALAQWNGILNQISEHGLKKASWRHLDEVDRQAIHNELKKLLDLIGKTLKPAARNRK